MGYEIDFLPVGNGSKNGDAIALRYGTDGDFKVMVVDGGTKESGQALVDHIIQFYGTDHVNYVVNTHPDSDHASGLTVVLENMTVGQLWMHRPWEHSKDIRDGFGDGRITVNSLSERLKEDLNNAYALEQLAIQKKIPIYEPFQGAKIGTFTVLSPSQADYEELVPQFDKTPQAKDQGLLAKAMTKVAEAINYIIPETWETETLSLLGGTSGENESSVVLYGEFDGKGILLTGDAGVLALTWAADYADKNNINLQQCKFIQVPHHGSRHNVAPEILDRILGPKVPEGLYHKTAIASVAKECETHPRRVVANAFLRRGVKISVTKGNTVCHSDCMPTRYGWSAAPTLPLYPTVEE